MHATGLSGRKAYAAVYGVNRPCTGSNAHVIQSKPDVVARVNYLKTEAAKTAVMDRHEISGFLTRVEANRRRSQLDAEHSATSSSVLTSFAMAGSSGFRQNKFACIKLAAKLQGFLRVAGFLIQPSPLIPNVLYPRNAPPSYRREAQVY